MAVTRSWTAAGAVPDPIAMEKAPAARTRLGWLLAASLFVAAGMGMVFEAKRTAFDGAERLVNLNTVAVPQELLPLLESIPDRAAREALAGGISTSWNAGGRCGTWGRWLMAWLGRGQARYPLRPRRQPGSS